MPKTGGEYLFGAAATLAGGAADYFRGRSFNSSFGLPLGKRQRLSMPVNAGATNVLQRAVIKSRSGRRVRKRSTKYLYKLSKATLGSCIFRWQGFLPYDDNGYYKCGYNRNADNSCEYPVYLFDLTSCNTRANNVNLFGFPFYRLISTAAGNFDWQVQLGQTSTGTVTANSWEWELTPAGTFTPSGSVGLGDSSVLDWSDIRLAMYGATSQTTRFNVKFIQFTNEAYHPRQVKQDPAVPASIANARDDEQQGRFNSAWEEEVKPLVFHPLHSAGNVPDIYRIMDNRVFNVQPDTTTNEAKAAPNVCLKLFKSMNRTCKWSWQKTDKADSTAIAGGNRLDPAAAAGLDSNSAFNQYFGTNVQPYVTPNARVYMLITAQAYVRTGQQVEGPTVAISQVNTPSFDLMVRNKHMYDKS